MQENKILYKMWLKAFIVDMLKCIKKNFVIFFFK